ncbi:MAG: hypothetical protein U1E42_03045 [Rhodospirillales bacterium]
MSPIIPPQNPESPAAEAKRATGAPPEEPAPLAPSGGDHFPVPDYRRAVFAAQPGAWTAWTAWTAAVTGLPAISAQEARAYHEIFAAEGGLQEDSRSHAASGLLPATVNALVAAGRLTGISPGTAPRRLSVQQRAAAYRAYFDNALRTIGGHHAFPRVGTATAAAAFADTLFRHGGRGGTRLVQRAMVATEPRGCAIDGRLGPRTFDLLCQLTTDDGRCRVLLERLADTRLAATGGSERPRIDHFRFRGAIDDRMSTALDRLARPLTG